MLSGVPRGRDDNFLLGMHDQHAEARQPGAQLHHEPERQMRGQQKTVSDSEDRGLRLSVRFAIWRNFGTGLTKL